MSSHKLIVLSWNTLADSLTKSGLTYDAFPHASLKSLSWEHRKQLIINNILTHRPDIICLYEVDHFAKSLRY